MIIHFLQKEIQITIFFKLFNLMKAKIYYNSELEYESNILNNQIIQILFIIMIIFFIKIILS
jgi:hypothetical protein